MPIHGAHLATLCALKLANLDTLARNDNLTRKLEYPRVPYPNEADIIQCNKVMNRVKVYFSIPEPNMDKLWVLV